ncbi:MULTISPECIES: alpha/beta hydrolase [Ralstonia solanacearum species complex]|uniref:alpha/beta hydrolase n=1 Tax=Ralstonia solanacearum species complex TaxID=3116862 RepID=UPI000E5763C8|nr:alpha/beta hydrolase [Ralstonia solanacearum]BEU70538.1 alpha/beta hydrolase [Ralstonia pseudosolanacearum]AXV75585.1 alpha/beta hydrolase [Ralstonia solanacearum]AXV89585.1 alpha/beta hydrolase [Ralstonia solanacearum]AXW20496.1 alpha/beta hydrolase [Ralstonia solanacearum]AXW77331.1 alpha/beta hydrolase [Ralstonia solanacearum]
MTQAPAAVDVLETRQRMKDGTELFVRTWLPACEAGAPRGTVILVHGMAEHSGRYPHVAKVLCELGLRVRAFDLRGHGKSGGPRMALDAPDNYLTDLAEILDATVAEWNEMPFVLGHSMGGLIVARFTTARVRPVRGVLLSSPALRIKLPPGANALRGLLSAIAPRLPVPNPVSPSRLSHDPAVGAAYRVDPLVQKTISASVLAFMLNAITQAQQDASRLEAPMLLIAGGSDTIVDPSGSQDFYANAPEDLRTLAWFETAYHELFNEAEPMRGEAFGKMRAWLAGRI